LSEGGDIARGQREFLPKRNHERRCPWGIERNGCVPMLTCRGRTPGTPQDLHKPRQAGTKGMRILVSTHFCTDERARIADISVGSATNRSTNTTRRMYSVSRPDASTNIHNPSALTALTTMPACPASTGGPQLYCSALSLNITGKRQYLCVACVWLGYGQVWRRAECFSPQVQLSTKQVSPPTRPATVELGGRVVHGYLSLTHLSVASLPRYV